MRASLLALASLTSLARAASISCGAPITSGTLWYGNATHGSYEGQIGVLEAYGNAELLAKYPNTEVIAHNISVIPCNSSYLNASIPASGAWGKDTPVILQLADDTSKCLALESNGAADVFITKQDCQYGDDDSQTVQFWTRAFKHHFLLPTCASKHDERWNLQFNQYDTEEVIANPPECFEGQTCQDGQHYSFIVKKSS